MFLENEIFNKNTVQLHDEENGFILGNMFPNEYNSYKNYKPSKLKTKTEKDDLLLKIYEYNFALNDIALFLDLNPNDKEVYRTFQKYTELEKKYIDLYERKYGPLDLCSSNYNDYSWFKGPWPFESGDIDV